MSKVIASRLGSSLVAILGASILSFVLLRVAPADPARLIVGDFATPKAVQQTRVQLGLTKPLPEQYYIYMRNFLSGRWGFSYSTGESVRSQIGKKLPASIELALYAFVWAFVVALALALIATYRRNPVLDGAARTFSFIGLGTPPFWLGLGLLVVFYRQWHLFPGPEGRLSQATVPPPSVTGLYTVDATLAGEWSVLWDALWHLILPALTLGLAVCAFLFRLLRANLLEVSREPYISFARSKGLTRWTAFRRHALPNAILPTITAGGLLLAQLIAGSVLVEKVYAWPGVGSLVVDGILQQDYNVVQAFILIGAFLYVLVNFGVDMLYRWMDPRASSNVFAD